MRAVIKRVEQATPKDPEFVFDCPGCGYGHWFKTTGDSPRWSWNGDYERPTISPSLMVRDGQIQFLSDSDHVLAGQTVPMVPV
jgi:hypothetical protein